MALALYMDHNVPRAITLGLRLRGVDVLTAFEDGTSNLDDPALLDRAGELERVLFTRDDDLLAEAVKRQRDGVLFRGVIYAHRLRVSIGACIEDLEIIAKAGEAEDLLNGVVVLASFEVKVSTARLRPRSWSSPVAGLDIPASRDFRGSSAYRRQMAVSLARRVPGELNREA